MFILKIILITVGIAFLTFGYFIYFKKQYHLINNFESDYKEGSKTESYAKRVGIIEFILGILLILTSICLIIFY